MSCNPVRAASVCGVLALSEPGFGPRRTAASVTTVLSAKHLANVVVSCLILPAAQKLHIPTVACCLPSSVMHGIFLAVSPRGPSFVSFLPLVTSHPIHGVVVRPVFLVFGDSFRTLRLCSKLCSLIPQRHRFASCYYEAWDRCHASRYVCSRKSTCCRFDFPSVVVFDMIVLGLASLAFVLGGVVLVLLFYSIQ